MLRVALAWLHLVALAVGFGAVAVRAAALRVRPLGSDAVRRAFRADTWWGVAAGLWLVTGLWRLLAGTEKATGYYLHNAAFHAKMGLFVVVLALEVWPMVTLIRWRRALGRAGHDRDAWAPPEPAARRIATISAVEAALVLAMALAANLMARGYGAFV